MNATVPREYCVQLNRLTNSLIGSEDCLYLDVHVPGVSNTSKMDNLSEDSDVNFREYIFVQNVNAGDNVPVIFYIFGGAFTEGNNRREGPDYLMDYDVIMVSVSYRLNMFGFLSTADDVVPGNMGLKDQSLALLWTRRYISDYGGDPNRVLLIGHSSGAACAHLHAYSPLSYGKIIVNIFDSLPRHKNES